MPTTTWNRNPDSKSWSIESIEPSCADHDTSFLAKHGHVRPMTGSRRDLSQLASDARDFFILWNQVPCCLLCPIEKGLITWSRNLNETKFRKGLLFRMWKHCGSRFATSRQQPVMTVHFWRCALLGNTVRFMFAPYERPIQKPELNTRNGAQWCPDHFIQRSSCSQNF